MCGYEANVAFVEGEEVFGAPLWKDMEGTRTWGDSINREDCSSVTDAWLAMTIVHGIREI